MIITNMENRLKNGCKVSLKTVTVDKPSQFYSYSFELVTIN